MASDKTEQLCAKRIARACSARHTKRDMQPASHSVPGFTPFMNVRWYHIHECGGRAYRAKGAETVMVNAASSPLLGKGLRAPVVVDICKETMKVLGVTAKDSADGRDPHPMETLFNKGF